MRLTKKRPLQAGCTVYLLSVWAFLSFSAVWRILLGAIGLWGCVVGAILARILRKSARFALIVCMPIALGAITVLARIDLPMHLWGDEGQNGEMHRVELICTEVGYSADYAAEHRVRVAAIDGRASVGEAILLCEHELDLSRGDRFVIGACIEAADGEAHGFAEYRACPILFSEKQDAEFLHIASDSVWERAARAMRARMEESLSAECVGVLNALLLGDRSALPEDLPLVFRALGVSHILAISGLHLTMMLFGLEWILKRLTLPLWVRDIAAILGTIGYAMLTGMGESVLRAGGMLILTRLSSRMGRESDPLTNLASALGVIVFFHPFSVFDIGLQLSALATLGILLVAKTRSERMWEKGRGFLRDFLGALAVGIGASAATLPLSYLYFGTYSSMGVPSTLLLSLPVTLCMASGALFLLLGFLPGVPWLADHSTRLLIGLAREMEHGRELLLAPSVWVLLLAVGVGAAMLLMRPIPSRLRRILAGTLVLVVAIGGAYFERAGSTDARMTFLSDGRDDGLILSEGGKTLVCDISDGSYDPQRAQSDAALQMHCATAWDGYLVTHYHQRTIRSLSRILRETRVGRVYLPMPMNEDERAISDRMAALAERFGSKPYLYAADGSEAIGVGELTLRVRKDALSRSTHPILRIEITCGTKRVNYLGASAHEGMDAENFVKWVGSADTLILGAHGPIVKTPLPHLSDICNFEIICASTELADALGITKTPILSGFDDPYPVPLTSR